jgi:hypothetical protein
MGTFPKSIVTEEQLAEAVENAVRRLIPDVIRIRYSFRPDNAGDDALYFRVVLSADASQRSRLREVGNRVRAVVNEEARPQEIWGVHPYFNFRSESEPESNAPGWV